MVNKYDCFDLPYYFVENAKFDVGILKEFRDHLEKHFVQQKQDLEKKALEIQKRFPQNSKEYGYDIDDYLDDTNHLFKEIVKIGDMLLMIGLYRIVELKTKNALKWRYEGGEAKLLQRFDWKKVKQRLEKDGIKIDDISYYSEIDELRLINNAIKHMGKVTQELSAEYPEWNAGDEFNNLSTKFYRYCEIIPKYVHKLVIKVVPPEKYKK